MMFLLGIAFSDIIQPVKKILESKNVALVVIGVFSTTCF